MQYFRVFYILVILCAGQASAETFDFTPEQFRAKLNDRLRTESLDNSNADSITIKSCKQTKTNFTCSFNEAGFQASVKEFKKLNMMNGRFSLKTILVMEVENGHVSLISVIGDRGDPANMFYFIGTVMTIVQTFDPERLIQDGATAKLSIDLGLLRGDDSEDIGKPKTTIEDYAVIQCVTMPSALTTTEGCIFLPRS